MIRIENSRVLFLGDLPIRRLLEFRPEFYPIMLRILDIVYERKIQMVASPITLANISFKAHEKAQPVLAREFKEFFTKSSQFMLREIDAEIAAVSAEFRSKYKLSLEDSLQLATAYVCGADLVLTENEEWKEVSDMNVVTLSEFA